jgi:glutamyl-tRNA synthetase
LTGPVRVRFAPSPTGYLHIGGVRTAFFNWLFAKHNRGVFVLRIEDTDRSRSTEEFISAIIEGMNWLGLFWDEGPYRQTDRIDNYRGYINKLIEEGFAYYCYCSPDELEQRRQENIARGKPPKYDGRCRSKERIQELKGSGVQNKNAVVRFRMPQEGQTVVSDLIKGQIMFENTQLDDLIIMRSDGTPTYNFVVVADDIDMKITHVIRGDDHLNNTPKQIHIYKALGYEAPSFAHLPMILGSDKARLSKRHGAMSVDVYREKGYLPEALTNYLARLGWSYGNQEVFPREELIEKFSLENVGKSAAVFNPEKLLWLNSQYMHTTASEKLAELVIPFLERHGIILEGQSIDKQWLSKAITSLKERSNTLEDLSHSLQYYIAEDVVIDTHAKEKFLTKDSLPYISELQQALSDIEDFTEGNIERVFKTIGEKHTIKLAKLAQPVRVVITGGTKSPGIFEVLEIVGKKKSLKRLERAINTIENSEKDA